MEKRQEKRRNRRFILTGVLVVLLFAVVDRSAQYIGQAKEKEQQEPQVLQAIEVGNQEVQEIQQRLDVSDINSPDALLMKADTGEIITEHNGTKRIYPASMTKIMTAILAIKKSPDMGESIQIPAEMFDELYAENASRAGFEPGEMATVQDLVYGVMLPSGAECCLTLADRIAGSEEAFVELMNQKAAEIGMQDTHFCNSTGLHDEQHYSTAMDMAMLLRYALKSDTFRAVFTSSEYTTHGSDLHPDGFTFDSTLFKYLENPAVTGGQLLGGKTGYTQEAGQCLASLANIDGEDYILVTAEAPGDHTTEQLHIDDAMTVFERLGEAKAGK